MSYYESVLKKMAYFNIKCNFICIMKIKKKKNERTFLLKNYVHNVTQHGVLECTYIHKDCMFITPTTKNFEECSIKKFDSNWVHRL